MAGLLARVYKYNSVPGDEGFMEFFSLHFHLFQLQYALLFQTEKNFLSGICFRQFYENVYRNGRKWKIFSQNIASK